MNGRAIYLFFMQVCGVVSQGGSWVFVGRLDLCHSCCSWDCVFVGVFMMVFLEPFEDCSECFFFLRSSLLGSMFDVFSFLFIEFCNIPVV